MESNAKKLEICEVCAANKAKFTCPKCEVRTCCLECVKIHKKELECDGIRDKTKFIPLKSFSDLDLLSDYRLLEEIGRSVEQFQKNPCKKFTRQQDLPRHLSMMKNAAHSRGVNLEFMPRNFSRNQENTTYFKWKTNELYWAVEFIFPQAENSKWIVKKVEDTKRLSVVLEELLNFNEPVSESEELSKLSILRSKLKFYQAAGLTGLKVFLKAEKIKKSGSKFYELDLTLSLRENLRNKTIIEFPIIYVVLKDHSDMFEIVDSDDEEVQVPSCSNEDEQEVNQNTKPWNRKRRHISGYNNQNPKYNNQNPNYNNQNQYKNKKWDKNPQSAPLVPKEKSTNNFFFNGEATDSEAEDDATTERNKNNQELNIPEYNELVKMKH